MSTDFENPHEIAYAIQWEDLQTVADERLGRPLTPDELLVLGRRIEDFLPWYDTVLAALENCIAEGQVRETTKT